VVVAKFGSNYALITGGKRLHTGETIALCEGFFNFSIAGDAIYLTFELEL
jgi:hypothetical protein